MNNNFNLKKFLAEGKLLKEERFYAPNYVKQKYGDKASEIENNIHDEEDNNPNIWDLYTSLESPEEVDDFVQGFINESELKENEGVDELPLTDEIKQDVDNAVERAIRDGEMEELQTVGYWENDFEDALLMNYEDQHPDAYMISDELHNYIQNKVYGE
jgi:hypothetical protein